MPAGLFRGYTPLIMMEKPLGISFEVYDWVPKDELWFLATNRLIKITNIGTASTPDNDALNEHGEAAHAQFDWDSRYAHFCASRGIPRFDFIARTRDDVIGLLGIRGEEFALLYPEFSKSSS